eukprot:snap_masked-scaffold_55-processed-gene-0.26-mRNA-1 protein AED:1.00 eAED:1.00 QI:0/-1/0/0/-1/1/1/0/69
MNSILAAFGVLHKVDYFKCYTIIYSYSDMCMSTLKLCFTLDSAEKLAEKQDLQLSGNSPRRYVDPKRIE